jgi:K+-transporting ATPase ATPase B chain
MFRNPVMFTVEICTAVMLVVCTWILAGEQTQGAFGYNFAIFVWLLFTLLFANFAEALAEARGKAQAASLRKTREETPAKVLKADGSVAERSSSDLKKGDRFVCEAGDLIPADGEIIEGIGHDRRKRHHRRKRSR